MDDTAASLAPAQEQHRDEKRAAIVNAVAASHGGRIELARSSDQGTAWRVIWRERRMATHKGPLVRPDLWVFTYGQAEDILLNLIRISVSWRGMRFRPLRADDVRRAG